MNEEDWIKEQNEMEFNYKFSDYVKNVNKNLWDKAVDFAASMTKYPGVEFGLPGTTG
jgi:hypothetical protein